MVHKQISTGKMSTVIGIFENQFKKNKPLTVVKPGSQSRRFTHINDTINICYFAWKKTFVDIIVLQIKIVIRFLKLRKFSSKKLNFLNLDQEKDMLQLLTDMNFSNKVYNITAKLN